MMDSEKAQLESERQMRQRVEEEKGQLQAAGSVNKQHLIHKTAFIL